MDVVDLKLLLVGLLSSIFAVEMREPVQLLQPSKQHQPLLSVGSNVRLNLDNSYDGE